MPRHTLIPRVAALALLAAPAFALADSGQPCPCSQPCASQSNDTRVERKDATPSPQPTSESEQQLRIWTLP